MRRRAAWIEIVLVAALLATAIVVVNPRANLPLNDDWNFALTTWKFADTGRFVYSHFTAMTLKAQVLWGALWTIAFGKSFDVLRASTLTLFALSVYVVWLTLKRLAVDPFVRVVAVLAFAFHPVIFWSAFTFMTQVPFVFCSVVAMYAFIRGTTDRAIVWIGAGSLAVIASYFIRQTGVVLAVAAVVVLLARKRPVWWSALAVAVVPVILFVILFFATDVLTGYPGQIREHFVIWQVSARRLPLIFGTVAFRYLYFNAQNAALFILPLTLPLLFQRSLYRGTVERIVFGVTGAAFLASAAFLILRGYPMPYWTRVPHYEIHPGNLLVDFGLGPLTLRDVWTLDHPYPFTLDPLLRQMLTFGSAILGAAAVTAVIAAWRAEPDESRQVARRLTSAHIVFATGSLFVSGIYFDRYTADSAWSLAILLPLLVDFTAAKRAIAAVSLVVVAVFSVGATQEYLDWNRARWKAFAALRARGVPLEQIDGGYEINQYLIGSFNGPVFLKKPGFSVIDDRYIITFTHVPKYRAVASYPYSGFFGTRRWSVLLSERVEGGPER